LDGINKGKFDGSSLDTDGTANRTDDGTLDFDGIKDGINDGSLDIDGTYDGMVDYSLDSDSVNQGKFYGLLDTLEWMMARWISMAPLATLGLAYI
jgi:hypothetical protein